MSELAQDLDHGKKGPYLRWLGLGYWLVYALLSLIYYKERTLFTDAAYQAFHLIQDGWPVVSHHRYGNVLVQVLPWLGLQLGAPLSVLLPLYSLSYPLLFAGVYAWLVFRWRCDLLGWTLILYTCLLTLDSFYYIQSEYYQAVAFSLLLFGYIRRHPALRNWQNWLVILLLLALVVNYYRLSLVVVLFLWGFFGLWEKDLRHWRFALMSILTLVLVWLQSQLFQSPYEVHKMALFYDALGKYGLHFWEIPANGKFLRKLIHIYYWLPLLLLLFTVLYLRKREYLKVFFIWLSCIAYVILLHYGSPNTTYRFYAELGYLPLAVFVALPLLHLVQQVSWRWLLPIFSLLLIQRLSLIQQNHQPFTKRLQWLESQLAQCPSDKCYYQQGEDPDGLLKMNWGIAYESLLLQAQVGSATGKTLLVLSNPQKKKEALENGNWWVAAFEKIPVTGLNTHYFQLDTLPYEEIRPEETPKAPPSK